MRLCLAILLTALAGAASADESVRICHGYGCLAQAHIRYTEGQLGLVRRIMARATDAASERERLAETLGSLYAWGGEQSDIHNDRGGNYADDHVSGRMDCIDHSTSTTRLLHLLVRRGYLRWHRVLEPQSRNFAGLVPVHWSAVIEEKQEDEPRRFAVDSWFVDNGQPAVILPLEEWKKGAGPDV
jgi:hypothetical protein